MPTQIGNRWLLKNIYIYDIGYRRRGGDEVKFSLLYMTHHVRMSELKSSHIVVP